MSTIQEKKTAPEQQDFKHLSRSSKDVMDAMKEAASTTRFEERAPKSFSEPSSGQILKENLTETYKGVPKSLEAEALQKAVMHSKK